MQRKLEVCVLGWTPGDRDSVEMPALGRLAGSVQCESSRAHATQHTRPDDRAVTGASARAMEASVATCKRRQLFDRGGPCQGPGSNCSSGGHASLRRQISSHAMLRWPRLVVAYASAAAGEQALRHVMRK